MRKGYPENLRIIRFPCTGRIEPEFILKALERADGVLILACHPGDCHFKEGNRIAYKRFLLLKNVLRSAGINSDRVKMDWVSASEGDRFVEVVNDFVEKLKSLEAQVINVAVK
jgi:F420-non-reducing hydrogenase iron-sulfur subunit